MGKPEVTLRVQPSAQPSTSAVIFEPGKRYRPRGISSFRERHYTAKCQPTDSISRRPLAKLLFATLGRECLGRPDSSPSTTARWPGACELSGSTCWHVSSGLLHTFPVVRAKLERLTSPRKAQLITVGEVRKDWTNWPRLGRDASDAQCPARHNNSRLWHNPGILMRSPSTSVISQTATRLHNPHCSSLVRGAPQKCIRETAGNCR